MQAQHLLFFPLTPFSKKKKVWHHDKSSNYGSWNHRVFMFLLRSLALGSEGCAALFYTSHAQCNKVKSVVEFKLRSSKLMLDSPDLLQTSNCERGTTFKLDFNIKKENIDPIDQMRNSNRCSKVKF